MRTLDFWYGWFLNPLVYGSYPQSMIDTLGSRLPVFTEAQVEMVKGSLDFVALNYYFPYLSSAGSSVATAEGSFWEDMNVTLTYADSWSLSQTGWGIYAPGLRDLLVYTHNK